MPWKTILKHKAFRAVLGLALFGLALPAKAESPAKPSYAPFEISLFPPVHIFHFERKVIVGLSVNIFYGVSASTYGLELGVVVNRERENVGGIQVAGVSNVVEGNATGLQLAGIFNYVAGHCLALQLSSVNHCNNGNAIQLSFLLNRLAEGTGFQLSPLVNVNHRFDGLQVGLHNLNGVNFRGLQIGGIHINNHKIEWSWTTAKIRFYPNQHTQGVSMGAVSVAAHLSGFQLSAANLNWGNTRGLQIGALLNHSADLSGAQLGVLNIANNVSGIQLGFLNIAHRLRGVQLGALNIAYGHRLPFMPLLNVGW